MVEATDDGPATAAAEMVVLEAKLHPPASHPEHVARPRLLQRLDEAAARPLTLVNAPAGFGKSTLLAAWCAQATSQRRSAWLSLDEGDNDPVVLWSYILHALRRVEPEHLGAGLALLDQPGVSLSRAVLPAVLNEIWSLAQPVVLVLDDYHLVREAACHESLRFFLRRLPPSLRLVIATRADPPLGLGTLRAQGELAELRGATLRFTEEEAESFLTERLGLPLTPAEVAQLTERTEGWPAGVYLAALSLRGRHDTAAFLADFAGSHRHIADYLGAEVLDHASATERAFLLQTSLLESFAAPLCDAVTGGTDAHERLRVLQRTNLFLVPLDEPPQWYRYHHLFRELLQLELARTAPALVPALHQRAVAWYRDAGDLTAAMRHALAARDTDVAGDLFLAAAQPLQQLGRLATLVRWMEELSAETIAARPALAVAVAWIAALSGRPQGEVERWLAVADAGRDDEDGPFVLGDHSLSAAVAMVRAAFPFDDVGRALAAAQSLVELETDPNRLSYLLANAVLGQALYLAGRPVEARGPLEAALHAPLAPRQVVGLTSVMGYLAQVSLALGETARADGLARRAVQLCEEHGLASHPSTVFAYLAQGTVLAAQGQFAEAEIVLGTGVEPHLPAFRHRPVNYARALLALAPVRFARGHSQAAEALLAEARAVIAGCADPGMLPTLLAVTARQLPRLPRRRTGLREELSERELRIMRLLASDLSQREIGQELYVSMNTIKTHLRSIYTKLDVASRRDAVARARAIGLIA